MGFEDPRYVQSVIADLQNQINQLKGAQPMLATQRGPLPGITRAVQINDVGQASSMWLNLNGNRAGQAPYQAVTDQNNVKRVEIGFLAANGNSPQQFGLRANDGGGAPIFDSLGLINVMTQLATASIGTTFNTSSGTPVTITGTQITFSLTRPITVFFFFGASVSINPTGVGNLNLIDLVVDGQNFGQTGGAGYMQLQYTSTPNGAITSSSTFALSLGTGSHAAELRASTNSSGGMGVIQAVIAAYNMGR